MQVVRIELTLAKL